jgi:3-oxoacyl-(acyl-carrier-protein) synthase
VQKIHRVAEMSAKIMGMGWVTPLGTDLETVWQRLQAGEAPEPKAVTNPETGAVHHYLAIPPKLVEHLGRNPRLRRSSVISYFAVAAGLAALEHAGIKLDADSAARTALVLAISDGGVIYTRRFFEQVVKLGANAASPLLFPETVYNAPASHLAAMLGIDGASYTLVGDNSVGLAALKFAEQLLDLGGLDRVLVVGAEEIDWVICEAYRDWRLVRTGASVSPEAPWKAWLGEGAAAVVLAREGEVELAAIHDGMAIFRQSQARLALDRVFFDLLDGAPADVVIGCGNGTFIDRAEAAAIARHCPKAAAYLPKCAFGEAPGASALLQVIVGALALLRGACPGAVEASAIRRVLVSVLGFNQQASGALLKRG